MSKSITSIPKWYVINTYSGHEYRVKRSLEERIANLGVQEYIPEVVVPDEEVIELRRNKKKIISHKFFPGYVMVKVLVEPMETPSGLEYKMESNTWFTIRNTPGVSGFIGNGYYPAPLNEIEAEKILQRVNKKAVIEDIKKPVNFSIGQIVDIIQGAFAGNQAIIKEIDNDNFKLKLEIGIFNRKAVIEAKFDEVSSI